MPRKVKSGGGRGRENKKIGRINPKKAVKKAAKIKEEF
jgi:hypothetical protein